MERTYSNAELQNGIASLEATLAKPNTHKGVWNSPAEAAVIRPLLERALANLKKMLKSQTS